MLDPYKLKIAAEKAELIIDILNKLDELFLNIETNSELVNSKAEDVKEYADKALLSETNAKTSEDNAKVSEDNASVSATTASTKASEASTSASNAQLEAWIAEANKKTADSYATEPHGEYVKVYTSNGDGTFTAIDTTEYSALHYATETDATNKADKLQTKDTTTVYDDATTDVNYKLYIDNGDIVLEEL